MSTTAYHPDSESALAFGWRVDAGAVLEGHQRLAAAVAQPWELPPGAPSAAVTDRRKLVSAERGAGVPLIALAEGMVLAAIRKTGVPMQRIRPALLALQETLGIEYALASERLYSDGAELLYDFAGSQSKTERHQTMELVVLRNGQRVFTEVVSDYLQRIEYADDGYAKLLHLPGYGRRQVVADPTRSFGQPMFVHGGAKVADVMDRFHAGESLDDLADDFGVPIEDLEDALRVASRRAV